MMEGRGGGWGEGPLHTNKQEAEDVSWRVKVQLFALSSADPSRSEPCINQGLIETAVVPLLRHQGEMTSCGKGASGNSLPQKMSGA